MDQDTHADWQQQQEVERRMWEEEQARYHAANPLWDRCIIHPERQRAKEHFCAECIADRRARYADKPWHPHEHIEATGWQFGHAYPPSYYTEKK